MAVQLRARSLAAVVAMTTGIGMVGVGVLPVATAQAATGASAVAVGARTGATRVPFAINDELAASVDVGSGNVMVTSSDRSAPGINGMVNFGLAYESLARSSGSAVTSGAAGSGWFLPLGQDTRVMANADGSLLYVGMDGQEGVFTPVSGTSGYRAPAGFKKSLVKNSDGSWSMTDLASRSVSRFPSTGRLASLTDRNGQAITFAYSGGNVSSATLPTGAVVTFTFVSGRLASMTRPANGALGAGTVAYGYDSAGRLVTITRPAIPGGAATTSRFTYSAAGDLASITDPLGNVTTLVYDGSHRVTSLAQGRSGNMATTRFSYASATSTMVAGPTTNQSLAVSSVPHTTYALSSTQRVVSVTDALGRSRAASYTLFFDIASATNGTGGTASAVYGANGGASMTKGTSAFGASQSWTYGTGVNAYSPSGSTDSQGNASLMSYDGRGNPSATTNGGGAIASVTYHLDGTVASSTDPAKHVTTYTESASGKYIAKITPPSGSRLGVTAIAGNPATAVTNGAGQTTRYAYNDRYGLTSASTTSSGSVTFAYDANGRVSARADRNQKVTYAYDVRGNLSSIVAAPVAGGSAPAASVVSYTYDLAGNMTSRSVAGKKTSYAYDAANQLTAMTGTTGAVTRFAYNKAGQRTDTWWRTNATHTVFAAHTRTVFGIGGNVAQVFTSVNSSDSASNRVSDYSYCNAKYVAGKACPWNTATSANTGLVQYITNNKAGTVIQLGYDTSNRLTSASNWAGHNYAYTYDAVGNRTSTKIDGKTTQSLAFTADNQISTAGFGYDKAGRRTADPKGGSTTWNDAGQSVAQTKGTTTGVLSYAGLGQDELVRQTSGSTVDTYVYGRDSQVGIPTMELAAASGAIDTVIDNDAHGQPIDFQEGSSAQYVMYDGTGRMIGTVDAAGYNTSTYHVDPYGALLSISSGGTVAPKVATANPDGSSTITASSAGSQSPWATFGIEGAVSRWWKQGARWNDTFTGTWTSADPITRLNDPSRANPYTYAGDNPINNTDPAGQDWLDSLYNDFVQVGGDLLACAGGGAAGAGVGGLAGTAAGPEGTAGGAAVGFVYGCGAGIFENETVGTTFFG